MAHLEVPKGNFFEDFTVGQNFQHGVPRTISEADATLYLALTGSRFPLNCAFTVAQSCGFNTAPLDNFLVFHVAFGKTVNDISLNAIANLGYAEVKFEHACFAGDTLSVSSKVIGLKENSNGKSGIVYVHSIAINQFDQVVVSWKRWVMVAKADPEANQTETVIPAYDTSVSPEQLHIPEELSFKNWQPHFSDNQLKLDDLSIGDVIFHRDGMTINDSDHSLATRLYQNNARVHFDQHMMNDRPNPHRLVYGGHIISMCRALSYNGLGNIAWPCAINAGTHANPSFAGDTIYCQSEILDLMALEDREDLGLVRVKMLGIKNNTPDNMDSMFVEKDGKRRHHSDVVLDLDYWAFMIR
ncbi:MaoC family dehydratase [Aliikangiella marina]|uniref:MaoC family dehydratase n=1 Tax=Aliikangiella marina TaxID=1712262 RepID=A0A545T6V3_9GAMM|nr:MaoC family dehydratase [Aliikangiella marina]TQV72902.1 MaoC family dehydratase [Aliikangiella marina]